MTRGNDSTSPILDKAGRDNDGVTHFANVPFSGLTKRELLSAMAMQALIAKIPLFDREGEHGIHTPTIEEIHGIRKQVAQSATDYADALIEALNEGKEQP